MSMRTDVLPREGCDERVTFQLRRVTYWTRNDPQMPDVSEDEEEGVKERNSPQSETDVTR